jgi:NitT/TauT family transport system substrate-binding protein
MPRSTPTRFRSPLAVLTAIVLTLAACGPGDGSSGSARPSGATGPSLRVGLGFIPSVQFAQFYLAQQAGYYREAGLEVTFENRIDPDLITLVGQGALDLGVADGTSVIPAVSQGIPIRYVATIYGRFPSIVFAKASSGIETPADLAGKRIGIPGRFGSSWVMLQALLDSAGLAPEDATVVEYPDFGQGIAVQQDAVVAATGFANNEPVQLELEGIETVVLRVDDIIALPGPGLIAGTSTLNAKPNEITAFVGATLRAMEEIARDPEVGLEAAITAVPELATDRANQLAILEATIDTWRTSAGPFGAIDREGWEASIAYLTELGLVPNAVTVDDLVREGHLPVGPVATPPATSAATP